MANLELSISQLQDVTATKVAKLKSEGVQMAMPFSLPAEQQTSIEVVNTLDQKVADLQQIQLEIKHQLTSNGIATVAVSQPGAIDYLRSQANGKVQLNLPGILNIAHAHQNGHIGAQTVATIVPGNPPENVLLHMKISGRLYKNSGVLVFSNDPLHDIQSHGDADGAARFMAALGRFSVTGGSNNGHNIEQRLILKEPGHFLELAALTADNTFTGLRARDVAKAKKPGEHLHTERRLQAPSLLTAQSVNEVVGQDKPSVLAPITVSDLFVTKNAQQRLLYTFVIGGKQYTPPEAFSPTITITPNDIVPETALSRPELLKQGSLEDLETTIIAGLVLQNSTTGLRRVMDKGDYATWNTDR